MYTDTCTGINERIRRLGEPYPKPRRHELTVKAGRFVDGLCQLHIYVLRHGWPLRPRGFSDFKPSPNFLLSSSEPVSRPWAGIRRSIGGLYIYAVRILIHSLCKDYLGRWASSHPRAISPLHLLTQINNASRYSPLIGRNGLVGLTLFWAVWGRSLRGGWGGRSRPGQACVMASPAQSLYSYLVMTRI